MFTVPTAHSLVPQCKKERAVQSVVYKKHYKCKKLYLKSLLSTNLIICFKIGCPTNFISLFLLMLYCVCAKTKIQHEGETERKYPSIFILVGQ